MLSRKTAIAITLCLCVAGTATTTAAAGGPGTAADRPNVILIIIDTLRADHVGHHGYSRPTTPNLDEFAAQAFTFKNAITPAPWTSPAIASLFTAQYPYVLGYDSDVVMLDNTALCLAEVLRNNGYKTKGVISHIYVSAELGFDQGFESFDEDNAQGHGHVSSPSVTDKGIAFIEKHENEFFLFLHYFDPHCDYILHDGYDYYPEYDGPLTSGQPIQDLREKAPGMSADDVRYLEALYDSEISFTDQHVARFLGHLKELDLYEKCLIVITADHGEEFLERGDYWIGHTKTTYQELIHVPLVIKLPGQKKGKVLEEYVSLIDLMPTILSAVDLDLPEGYEHDGHPLTLSHDAPIKTRPVFSETQRWGTHRSVIVDGYKLLYDIKARETYLFNLKLDPSEKEDLAEDDADKVRELWPRLNKWDYDMRLKRTKFVSQRPRLTKQQREQLKSLGYIR